MFPQTMASMKAWAIDIRSFAGFMGRAHIASFAVVSFVWILIFPTAGWLHPNAGGTQVALIHLYLVPISMLTIPWFWMGSCYLGVSQFWYVTYVVGLLHGIGIVVLGNFLRASYFQESIHKVYYNESALDGAFTFVILSEFAYFWALAGLGSLFYLFFVNFFFPTMATWFFDDPLRPNARVSPHRPLYRGVRRSKIRSF